MTATGMAMTPSNKKIWSYMVKHRPRASEEIREKIKIALDKKKDKDKPKEKAKKAVRYCK